MFEPLEDRRLLATSYWNTTAVDGSWSKTANWSAGIPNSTTEAHFSTSNLTTTLNNGDKNAQGIVFEDLGLGISDFTMNVGSGGVLYTWDKGITVNGGNQTFNSVQVRPRVTSTIANHGTGLLDFNSEMLFHLTGTTAAFTFDGSGNIDLARYARRTSGMDVDIVKQGSGTLTIQGANTTPAASNGVGGIDGQMTILEGVVSINAEANLGLNPAAFDAGLLTLNGGTLRATGSFAIDDANRGVTLGVSHGTFDVPGTHTLTIANVIAGSGDLAKTGSGTVVLSNTSAYTGTTAVSNGKLLVNGDASAATGAVTVNSGATLGGAGTIGGGVTINPNGILAPGSNVGTLTLNNGLTLSDTSSFAVEINGPTAGSQHDQIRVLGSIALNGATLNATGTIASASGRLIVLIDNDGSDPVGGTFKDSLGATLAEGATVTVNGIDFVLSYAGGDGNDAVLFQAGAAGTIGTAGDDEFELRQVDIGGADYLQLLAGGAVVDSRAAAAVTSWTIDGAGGSDTLTVHYGGTGGFFAQPVTFHGGESAGDNDRLDVVGGEFASVTVTFGGQGGPALDGRLDVEDAGGGASTISFTGLEPVDMTGSTVTDLVLNLPVGADN
ncbi:MAG TPA: autotransporter-associated beta strand repeat-containing protein, partial [Candidatus Anammoximicrobium sp.]|nr:autotransporter-associated beta strand repeat-containing protein [Candidatus Anammoximicrobium sp.]